MLVEGQRNWELFRERYLELISIDQEYQVLQQQVIELESEMSIMQDDYQYVEDKYEIIQLSYLELEDKIQELEELKSSYLKLQETIDLFSISNNSRKINFSINIKDICEVHDEWKFDIGYGIIMKIRMWVQVSPYDSQIIIGHTWIRGDTQGNLGGGSRTYAQLPDLLEGYAYCEIYDKGNFVQAEIGVIPLQPSWEGMDRSATFPKVIE